MKTTRRIILARWVKHEFVRAARALATDVSRIEVLQAIISQQEKSTERFIKVGGTTFLGMFWLRSHFVVSEIKFSIFGQDFSSSASYLLFVLGFSYLGMMNELFNFCYLDVFIGTIAKSSFGLNTSVGLNSIYNARSLWGAAGNMQYRFLKSGNALLVTAITTFILLLVPILFALFFVGYEIIRMIVETWVNGTNNSFEKMILTITVAVTIFPWIWVIINFVPFKFTKNSQYIRWIFLINLYRSNGVVPPGIQRWLLDKQK